MCIKDFIYRFKRKVGIDEPQEFIDFLRRKGIRIGKGTVAFSKNIIIDAQRPWMIEIGEYCKITHGVVILQHDYSRSVLRRVYGDIVGESKKTIIGDNVFLGINSIILMGSRIGSNVIVGAGSVVSGVIPDNVVIAGNPARIIRNLDDHYKGRKREYISEAKQTALEFKRTYNRNPTIEEMGQFWPIFLEKNKMELKKNNILTKLSGDDEVEIIKCWLESESLFASYNEFLKYCGL